MVEITPEHIKIAKIIARSYYQRKTASGGAVTRCDFTSLALYGLGLAAVTFDERLGNTFMTYARYRVNGVIGDYLRSIDTLTRTKRQEVKDSNTPCQAGLYSLDVKMNLHTQGPLPDEQAHKLHMDRQVQQAIANLSERHRTIVRMRMDGKTKGEIGRTLGLSLSTIAACEQTAYAHLRELLPPPNAALWN